MKQRTSFLAVGIVAFSAFVLASCSDSGSNTPADQDGDIDGDVTEVTEQAETAEPELEAYTYPDPTFIHEVRTQTGAATDDPYAQELMERFNTTGQLPSLNVTAMAAFGGGVAVGTTEGVYFKAAAATSFSALTLPGGAGAVVALSRTSGPDGLLAVALVDRVELVDPLGVAAGGSIPFAEGGITSITADSQSIVVGAGAGVFIHPTGGDWTAVDGSAGKSATSVALTDDGRLLIGSAAGVMVVTGGAADFWTAAEAELPDDDVRAIAACGTKAVVACATGIAINDGSATTLYKAEKGGLPMDELLVVDCNDNGVLMGHAIGATFMTWDAGHIDHYHSGRWMPSVTLPYNSSYYAQDNRVPALALYGTDRWLGTHLGVSRIYLEQRTLADKEAHFNTNWVPYFWRMGGFFSSDAYTPNSPWDTLDAMNLGDKDNDGLWTQMMIGGWCFAYSVTGEQRYKDLARKGMENMFKLVDYPAVTFQEKGMSRGFIARSIISAEEAELYSGKIAQAEKVSRADDSKKDLLRWNKVTIDGKDYLWKADTSSDELAGHFFGFPVYYDLCATTPAEKAEVASYAEVVAAYIINGGYVLVDLDGTRTLHGHWDPATISIAVDGIVKCSSRGYEMTDCVEAYYGGGWLNSIEILGTLLAAYHMTGRQDFYDGYEELIQIHRYNEVAMANANTYTITKPGIANHSDHELAMLAYTTLIRYEANDARRAKWIESLEFLYTYELGERNPWWAAVCALSGCRNPAADIASSVRTLREMPYDNRVWNVNSAHRKDMTLRSNDRHDNQQCDTVFSYDEIRTMWWNGNPYSVEDGGNGQERQAPTNFLLPYYMNRYAGILTGSSSR